MVIKCAACGHTATLVKFYFAGRIYLAVALEMACDCVDPNDALKEEVAQPMPEEMRE